MSYLRIYIKSRSHGFSIGIEELTIFKICILILYGKNSKNIINIKYDNRNKTTCAFLIFAIHKVNNRQPFLLPKIIIYSVLCFSYFAIHKVYNRQPFLLQKK